MMEDLREMKLAELVRIRGDIDNVIQERGKLAGMDLGSVLRHIAIRDVPSRKYGSPTTAITRRCRLVDGSER